MQTVLNSLTLAEKKTASVRPSPACMRKRRRWPHVPMLWLAIATIGVLCLAPRFVENTFALNMPVDCKNYITGMGLLATQCGVVRVPEDRAHSEGRSINIVYRVVPALNPQAKGLPIFHLEGGPGGSAISNFAFSWVGAYQLLRQEHPVVLIDQRGTGLSLPLTCSEVSDPVLVDLKLNWTADQEQAALIDRLEKCRDRLAQAADLRFYTTSNLADDTDAVRAALGYDLIDVFGNSYGTSLAQVYLKRHGDHIAAMILDGTVGPWNDWIFDGPNNSQAALDSVFALCQTDKLCSKRYPNSPADLTNSLRILRTDAPTTLTYNGKNTFTGKTYQVVVTQRRFVAVLGQMLYNGADDTRIPKLLSATTQGNFQQVADVLASQGTDETVATGLYYSIVCSQLNRSAHDSIDQQSIFSQ